MIDTNLSEAFASYKVKSARRMRSAMTTEGNLVISCWYAGFKRADPEALRYEEDLSGQSDDIASTLRGHLAEALSSEAEVRVIIAMATVEKPKDYGDVPPVRTSYYARKDLIGRLCSFNGEQFIVDFHRAPSATPDVVKGPRRMKKS